MNKFTIFLTVLSLMGVAIFGLVLFLSWWDFHTSVFKAHYVVKLPWWTIPVLLLSLAWLITILNS